MPDNLSFEYDDSLFEGNDEIQSHSHLWIIGLVTFIAHVVIFCFGVPANVYVLCRLWKFAKEDREKYENGTGLGLFVMSTADLFSLLAISLQLVLPAIIVSAPEVVKTVACKTLIFATHTMTSVSIWSWLLMSTLRYLAIRHPLLHLRLWRAPYRAIALMIFLSALTNIWLLFSVSSGPMGCTQRTLTIGSVGGEGINRGLHLAECIWSYCLPVGAILYMDVMVFLYCPRRSIKGMSIGKRNGSTQVHGTAAHSNNKKKANRGLWKWLLIAFVDIVLNTPENLYRLITLLGIEIMTENLFYYYSFRMIAQVLYYAQFAFNAVYLSLFVFDRNIRPSAPQSSTQNFSVIQTRLISTQGYSSIEQCRQNRYRPLASVAEPLGTSI